MVACSGASSMVRRALLLLLSGATVLAAGITDLEWSTTINRAGRQRMLSQKMSKEFLLVALGLSATDDKDLMEATVGEFDDMLGKLISGSAGDSIAAPPNTEIENQLGTVQTLWQEFKTLLTSNVDASPISNDVLADVASKSVPLLQQMNTAVGMYAAAATAAGAGAPGAMVNIAGRQRMLSQKMSKEAFLVALGVDVSGSKAALMATKELFESSFQDLVLGSAELGVAKTDDACILQQMGMVNGLWVSFEPLLNEVLNGDGTVATATQEKIRTQNPTLLTEMNNAVTLYVESTTGSVTCQLAAPTAAEFAAVINKAGRQRMLSQKMSKELFLKAVGKSVLSKMEATVAEFSTALQQLMLGSEADDLPPPPNEQIATQLGVVVDHWLPLLSTLQDVISSGSVSEDNISAIAEGNLPLLTEMNKAVGFYAAAATAANAGAPSTVVNKAGRQRMLTQKMSKEAMLVKLGREAAANKATLQQTITEFDEVLKGLVDGSSKHELPATTDKCILQKLDEVKALWEPFEQVMGKFADGSATDADVTTVADTNEPLLSKMNEAVGLYVQAAANATLTCDDASGDKGTTDAAWGDRVPAVATLMAVGVLMQAAIAE